MVLVALAATLLYDRLTDVTRRRRAGAQERVPIVVATPALEAPLPLVLEHPLATTGGRAQVVAFMERPSHPQTAPLARISVPAAGGLDLLAALTLPTGSDEDPIHILAHRVAALRLLGLEYIRDAHPLFRAPAEVPATPRREPAASVVAFAPRAEATPGDRPRRPARRRSGVRLQSRTLRLVVAAAPEQPLT